jgi:predicted nuclease with TOPRIM domain
MTQVNSGITLTGGPNSDPNSDANIVDRAADSADRALEATRRLSDSAFDNLADKLQALRERASPAVDRLISPYDDALRYTRQAPVRALLISAAVGAGLMVLFGWMRSNRRER